jgi:DNA-binding Lrp family transcriptional regulator
MPEGPLCKTERLILNAIQDLFPIDREPFLALAKRLNEEHNLNLTEEGLIEALKSLKERKYLRRLGGIFNSRPLGYLSTLCAAKVPQDKLEAFVSCVNSYPQVTHNYIRNNPFNVWFTFSYENKDELDELLNKLKKETTVTEIFELSARKIFKIRAVFKLT